jgi:hypothetical protein
VCRFPSGDGVFTRPPAHRPAPPALARPGRRSGRSAFRALWNSRRTRPVARTSAGAQTRPAACKFVYVESLGQSPIRGEEVPHMIDRIVTQNAHTRGAQCPPRPPGQFNSRSQPRVGAALAHALAPDAVPGTGTSAGCVSKVAGATRTAGSSLPSASNAARLLSFPCDRQTSRAARSPPLHGRGAHDPEGQPRRRVRAGLCRAEHPPHFPPCPTCSSPPQSLRIE